MNTKREYSKKSGALSKKHTSRPSRTFGYRGDCPTGKIRYRDHKEAVSALHRTQKVKALALDLCGSSSRSEKRTYFCEKCHGHHLTSWESQSAKPGRVYA